MQYILLVIADLLMAGSFAFNKIYQSKNGTSSKSGFAFNSILGLFTAVVFLIINGFKLDFSFYSFIMAAIFTVLVMSYTILGFHLLSSGTMALYTLFLMTGGMTVPYIFGLVFLDETFSVLRMVGLILILGGVIFSNISKEKINSKQLLMCIAVFILNGFVSVTSKLHQVESVYPTIGELDFTIIGGLFKFVFAGILFFLTKTSSKPTEKLKFSKMTILIILCSALAGGISSIILLFGATSLPASVLYPFTTGGSIVVSSILGVIAFKEKLSRNLILGIALCFIGTLMFL